MNEKTSLPDWVVHKQKKSLKKNVEYRERVTLLQDFSFPEAATRIKLTPDEQYIIACGVYKPQVRVYDLTQTSLKFDRHFTSENITFECLSDDWQKIAFLQSNRTIEFHSQTGMYHSLRIPRFGRDMSYQKSNCDLLICGASPELWRFNLEVGSFLKSYESSQMDEMNCVETNQCHDLTVIGGKVAEFIDPRQKKSVCHLSSLADVTCASFLTSPQEVAIGDASGVVKIYDMRMKTPISDIDHQYGFPILQIQQHDKQIISTDKKMLKVWNKDDSSLFTVIESENNINSFCHHSSSGLLHLATEDSHMKSFYVPSMGPAPKWCHFLDNVIEEATKTENVNYDHYRFVTEAEMRELSVEHLIGTNVVKAYMHGYFIDAKLYERVRAIANPFAYEQWKMSQLKEKLEKKNSSRIVPRAEFQNKLDKLNKDTRFEVEGMEDDFAVDVDHEDWIRHNASSNRK